VGSADLGAAPEWEENNETKTGYKIWLVLTDDVTSSGMTSWNPTDYLFEHNLIP